MNRIVSALAFALLVGCSGTPEAAESDPPPGEAEPSDASTPPASSSKKTRVDDCDPYALLQEAVEGLKAKVTRAVITGALEEDERLGVGKIKFQPQRGVRFTRSGRSFEEHLLEELKAAGLPVANEGQTADLTVQGLISLDLRKAGESRQVDGKVFLQVLRGSAVRCTNTARKRWTSGPR